MKKIYYYVDISIIQKKMIKIYKFLNLQNNYIKQNKNK